MVQFVTQLAIFLPKAMFAPEFNDQLVEVEEDVAQLVLQRVRFLPMAMFLPELVDRLEEVDNVVHLVLQLVRCQPKVIHDVVLPHRLVLDEDPREKLDLVEVL